MAAITQLPETIRSDISIYLAPEEKILKAMSSSSDKSGVSGQIWLVLTTRSLFFHTCQTGKEPVIALLERKAVKEIEYFQRLKEIVLTFIPVRNPQNTTKLAFGIDKKDELEAFCEDLADLINFKKETSNGIKSFATAATNGSEKPQSKAGNETGKQEPDKAMPVRHAASIGNLNVPPKPSPETAKSVSSTIVPEAPEVKLSRTIADSTNSVRKTEGPGFRYVLAATLISITVAFIWYQFFMVLSKHRD